MCVRFTRKGRRKSLQSIKLLRVPKIFVLSLRGFLVLFFVEGLLEFQLFSAVGTVFIRAGQMLACSAFLRLSVRFIHSLTHSLTFKKK